jgi:hypothetical protein
MMVENINIKKERFKVSFKSDSGKLINYFETSNDKIINSENMKNNYNRKGVSVKCENWNSIGNFEIKNTQKSSFRYLGLSIVLLLMVLLMGNLVIGLGITPGRTTIDYVSGLEEEVSFSIVNNEHKDMQVVLTVQGELAESVTLFDNLIEFLPSEESKSFKYKISLPSYIASEDGLHTAEIVALEVPKAGNQGTFVGATVAVVSQIHVYVPCPDKCIDSDIVILDGEQNTTATFIIPVINRGQLGIGDVRAIIDIYSKLNEKIDSIETDFKSVDSGQRTELSAKWPVTVNVGEYIAKVTVFYDGKSKSFEKIFSIGTQSLSIESILVNEFTLGEIAKLQILVENKWNQDLKEVFANLLVYNNANQVMADVRSATETVPALSKKELIAYWDTIGLREGEYNGELFVRYGQTRSTDRNLLLRVSPNNLQITGVGFAIRPSGRGGINITTILMILVILMLIVNLAWFVFFRRIMGKRRK